MQTGGKVYLRKKVKLEEKEFIKFLQGSRGKKIRGNRQNFEKSRNNKLVSIPVFERFGKEEFSR